MVARGLKTDYYKDIIFQVLGLAWLIWGETKIILTNFDLANQLKQPIKCGVDTGLLATYGFHHNTSNTTTTAITTNTTLPDQITAMLRIRDQCDYKGGVYYIPERVWGAENVIFVVLNYVFLVFFALYSCFFLTFSTYLYGKIILYTDNGPECHMEQQKVDTFRSVYMTAISLLTYVFFFIYAVSLNKLTAFGLWHKNTVTGVAQAQLGTAVDQTVDIHSWEDLFSPDFSALLTLEVPEEGDEQFLGQYIHNTCLFCVMTLMKNVYFSVVYDITSDLNIVTLLFSSIPAVFIIMTAFMPLLSSLYIFYNVHYVYAMAFDFSFNHVLRTTVFGGILYGMAQVPFLFTGWITPALAKAGMVHEVYVDELAKREEGKEPGLFDCTYWNVLRYILGKTSWCPTFCHLFSGIVGLSCIGYAVSQANTEANMQPFFVTLGTWAAGLCLSCVFFLLSICKLNTYPNIEGKETNAVLKTAAMSVIDLVQAAMKAAENGVP